MKWWTGIIMLFGIQFAPMTTDAKTPDACTPAVEEVCDKYKGEGARYGLCVAYCEAQDCDSIEPGDQSCDQLSENFADYSAQKGFKDTRISCRTGGCSEEDIKCGGTEQLCLDGTGCVARCSVVAVGGKCAEQPACKPCKIERELASRSQPGGRGRRARRLMCAVPAAPAGGRHAWLGAGWPGDGGVGVGERGREGVNVDYALGRQVRLGLV